jgi:hypothetical protein
MFDQAQKSIVRGPFHKRFDKLRITAKRPHTFAWQLAHFEASPSLGKAGRLMQAAL